MTDENARHESRTAWEQFAARHPGHRFLACETLYSLSEEVLDAIAESIPNFFTDADRQFEEDLTRTASFGFFHHRALGTSPEFQAQQLKNAEDINKLLAKDYRNRGLTDFEIKEHVTRSKELQAETDLRKQSYSGWLVTNVSFRIEVHALRSKWQSLVSSIGKFPSFPSWPTYDIGITQEVPEDFGADFLTLYRRWGLERLSTWEWPEPMNPDLVGGMRDDYELLSRTGVVLFVPWYLLRGEKLNLQEVVRRARATNIPDHLGNWMQKKSGRPGDDLGDLRYQQLGWLYRNYELVLNQRYGAEVRAGGVKSKLDRAFSDCWPNSGEESFRKLRLEFQRLMSQIRT